MPEPTTLSVTVWLQQLDDLRAAATPGEWVFADEMDRAGVISGSILARDELGLLCAWEVASTSHGGVEPDDDQNGRTRANAEYIEAMHRALPQLTAAVRAVLGLADELDFYTTQRGTPAAGSHDDGVNKAQADAARLIRTAIGSVTA